MRIDLVFPKFKLLSGAERLILSLGVALAKRGESVRVVCHHFDPSCRLVAGDLEIVETGAALEPTGNHYLDAAVSYARAFELAKFLTGDVACLFGPALPLVLRRKRLPKRVLHFCYEPPRAVDVDRSDVLRRVGRLAPVVGAGLRLYGAIDRALVRRADAILVNGEFGRERVREAYGLPSHVITHGISLSQPAQSRASMRRGFGIDPDVPVAIVVGFLHPRKRVDLLLRAWALVEKDRPDAELWVIGDGPERGALEALTGSLGLRGLRFRGFVPEEELPGIYAAADLLLHAARLETFGLTVIEAATFGLPAVVVDEGGPRTTVLDGRTGLRCPAEASALAAAVTRLLDAPDEGRRMGSEAEAWVRERFTWERGAADFVDACGAGRS